ncbi:hypothetical protein COCCADRAFT_31737 [Bipolaris zeicola 26-R-13]|uniref:NAD(P)-binding protein n=1 Tax=Cochliobolus carbonum (strain 26-R-13) TaxID=930089 RepID=W6YJ37_COCC2|nr:uncharacterized protein COCCADRAFT_31737 [Bipolaris zeicola 26-R-13]EUC39372.1 hypothetical protein COCCADRAFT_31737 [Bipolaris zeicola 26-R-13]
MASTDKTIVLITGANTGIGFELTKQLLSHASKHVLLGSRSASKGSKAVQDLQSQNLPGTVEFLQIDVSKQDSIVAAAKHVKETHGHLDVLVNNAGIFSSGDPDTTDIQSLVDAFTTNAAGPFAIVKVFEPLLSLVFASTPRIINISSALGSISTRLNKSSPIYAFKSYAYRLSKAALNMATAAQHAEYLGRGWRVFAFCPGITQSEMTRRINVYDGAKPTSRGAAPLVGIVDGERDADAGRLLTADTESGVYMSEIALLYGYSMEELPYVL